MHADFTAENKREIVVSTLTFNGLVLIPFAFLLALGFVSFNANLLKAIGLGNAVFIMIELLTLVFADEEADNSLTNDDSTPE